MRITCTCLLLSFGLLAGCSADTDTDTDTARRPAPEKVQAMAWEKAPTVPAGVIALEGVRFGMPLKEFRPLFKIRKEQKKSKKDKEPNVHLMLDTDALVDFALDAYMGHPVQGGTAAFYDGHLTHLTINFHNSELPAFLRDFRRRFGKPSEAHVPDQEGVFAYGWSPKGGELVKIFPGGKQDSFIELGSPSFAREYARRLKKLMKAELARLMKKPFYTAELTCLVQNRRTRLLACLMDSYLKVSSGVKTKIYMPRDLMQSGYGKSIPLKEHFQIQARNSAGSRYMFLHIVIRDRLDRVVFEDSAASGGWINVGN